MSHNRRKKFNNAVKNWHAFNVGIATQKTQFSGRKKRSLLRRLFKVER